MKYVQTAEYRNKIINVEPYIVERDMFITETLSKLVQMKLFLQSDKIICYPTRESEREYLINKLDDLYKRGLELVK